MGKSNRWRFVAELRNSPLVWVLWIAWAVLSALSTLSFLFPKMGNYVPQRPWYIWVISGLLIGIGALFEGAYRQAALLWQLTDSGHLDAEAQGNAAALAGLPVYAETLSHEILAVCEGLQLNMEVYLFVNIKMVSTVDTGIFKTCIHVKTQSGNRYRGDRILDLLGWLLVEEFFDQRFSMTNSRDVALETVALGTEQLAAGRPEKGWMGFKISTDVVATDRKMLDQITNMNLQIEDGMGEKHKLQFPDRTSWPLTRDKIIHASIRQPL